MPDSALQEAVEAKAGVDRSGWSAAARSTELIEMLEARARLDAVILKATGQWDGEQCWALDDALSAPSWITHRVAITKTDAMVLVRAARIRSEARDHGQGRRRRRHLACPRDDHRPRRAPTRAALSRARGRHSRRRTSARPRRLQARHGPLARCADAVADTKDALNDVEGNYLDVTKTFRNVGHLEGRLDPVSTATLLQALDKLEPPDPPDAPVRRSIAQRRADALMRLVIGDRPPPVNIDIIADVDTFAGRPSPDLTFGCCEIQGFGPISPALVRTLACDAAIGRVLIRGKSEVLDLGRRTRLISPAQRRALHVRDRKCVEHGCDLPGTFCDGHHIQHWTRHGETNLDNLEFRCRRHHVLQHLRDVVDTSERLRE